MSVNKILKLISKKNLADDLDESRRNEIADDVVKGCQIDEESRATWLDINLEAMKIIKHCEDDDGEKDFPFHGAAKVVYPLLAPAVIQMAARLSTHIVQNGKVCYFTALGEDYQVPVENQQQQPQQPMVPGMQGQGQQMQQEWKKASQAKRLTDFASYEFLVNSDTWLSDTQKLCAILSSWGTAFRQVYYDPISKKTCHEVIPPEDVIINHNISSLDKAPRITVRSYLRKNDIVSLIHSGQFLDIDVDMLDDEVDLEANNDSREINPAHEFLCQMLYIDLDEDGYAEPYKAYVHKKHSKLYGLYPAYKVKDIEIDKESQKILRIKPRIDIIDWHCIDDPEGKFYSIGLNYLLTHQNKSITSILRQLIDSGTYANTQGGFITKAFKTQERNISFEMGQFKVLECDYNVNPKDHIIPLPFKEPSQVLLALLQTLITAGKETGFITDVLTGDIESQNTPATTMLSMVEQGTRAFKPVIQKFRTSLKKEFRAWFEICSDYLDVNEQGRKYVALSGRSIEISKRDFNADDVEVSPVADPTMSSEAHKYAKLKFITDMFNTPVVQAMNIQEALKTIFEGMQFENAQQLVAQPQPQAPDPAMMKLQLEQQKMAAKQENDQMKLQIQTMKQELDKIKTQIKISEIQIKRGESDNKQRAMDAHAAKEFAEATIKNRLATVAEEKLDVERERLRIMEKQSRDKGSSSQD